MHYNSDDKASKSVTRDPPDSHHCSFFPNWTNKYINQHAHVSVCVCVFYVTRPSALDAASRVHISPHHRHNECGANCRLAWPPKHQPATRKADQKKKQHAHGKSFLHNCALGNQWTYVCALEKLRVCFIILVAPLWVVQRKHTHMQTHARIMTSRRAKPQQLKYDVRRSLLPLPLWSAMCPQRLVAPLVCVGVCVCVNWISHI